MNILFVHEIDWLNKVVFEIHNMADSLAVLGHKVYAVDYPDKWKKDGAFDFGSLKTRETDGVARALPGASVTLRSPGIIKIPGLSRFSAAFTHYFEIQDLIKKHNIDIIMLYSVPTNGLQTVQLARHFKIPVVFRSIDILHKLVRYPALRPATKCLEKHVYSRVDRILAITPNHSRYVISMGAPADKVRLLPLPIDTSIFHPAPPPTDLRLKWGLSADDKVIVFIGTLFEFSGLDGFIREFWSVKEAVPAAKLLIVGDGPQRPELDRIISQQELGKEVIITGFQPYNTMPQYINLADICINPFLDSESTREIFPGKIIQYLACAKPTVATPLLGITSLVKDDSGGIVYAPDAQHMAQDVISLLQTPGRGRELGQAGLSYVRQNHEQVKISKQLEKELMELVGQKIMTGKNP